MIFFLKTKKSDPAARSINHNTRVTFFIHGTWFSDTEISYWFPLHQSLNMRPTDFTFLVSTAGLHEERHENLGPVDFVLH